MQLSLRVGWLDEGSWNWVDGPNARPVKALWGMGKDMRMRAWRALGPFGGLERLELGGKPNAKCPVEVEELGVILGMEGGVEMEEEGGQDRLEQLKEVILEFGTLGDAGMELLASQGCGTNLKTLCLECA